MVEDFEDYADLNGGATAVAIREAADAPSTHSTTMQALVDDLSDDSTQVRANVEGDISDATTMNLHPASEAARRLTQSGLFAVGLLNSFADTVETFDTEVEAINTELHDNTYARWQAQSGSTSDNSEAGSAEDDTDDLSYDELKRQEKAKLQARYNTASTTLETEADRVAGLFEGSPDLADVKALVLAGYIPLQHAGVWLNLKLTEEETKQAQLATVEQMTPAEQVEYVKTHEDIDPAIAEVISPEAQEILANDVAEQIKEDGTVGRDTVDIMLLLAGQQAFSHQLFSQVTPREFAAEISDLNSDVFPQPAPDDAPSEGDIALYRDFVNASGLALATYSQADGDYAPPANLAETWFNAITNDDHKQDASALTLLVKAGGHQAAYDDDFISDLTGRVYEWELDQDGKVWGPRDTDVIYDPNDPPKHTTIYDDYGGTSGQWSGGTRATDGLANLLGGMANSPEGAQDFFHGRYDGSSQSLDERMDYLVGGGDGRTWDGADKSDDGDGLGRALQAAIVGEETRDVDGTEIANKLFENIAKHGGEKNEMFDNKWHVGPNMTDSLGLIASGYSDDLYDMLSNTPPASGGTHLNVSQAVLADVLGEIGQSSDKTGLETLTTSMLLQCRNENLELLYGHDGPRELSALSGFEGVQLANGDVMGNLVHYGTALWAGNEATDADRAALVSKALDIAGGFVPGAGSVLGEGASDLAKATYDTIKSTSLSQISEAVKNSAPASAGEYRDDATQNLPDQLRYDAISDLYRAGYLGEQDTPHGHYEGVDPNLFTGEPPTLRRDLYDSDGYALDEDIPQAERDSILNAYRDLRRDDSRVWELAYENTYNGNFYDRMQNPTQMDGDGK